MQALELRPEPITLGRDDTCGFVLASEQVSRQHAELDLRAGAPRLRDLGSTNGTFVNGERVGSKSLKPNDVIRLGDFIGVIKIVFGDPASSSEMVELLPGMLVGPALAPAVALAKQAARSSLPIVLEGETGTGKEQFARAVHQWSRRSGDFIAVNCAALRPSTAYASLFGHTRGAFTGADRAHTGYFGAADQGTLLLDEILDLNLEIQGALLRALQEREFTPLGANRPTKADVRIIAAGQESLVEAAQSGRLREDLLGRLTGFIITLPPLRDRREEVPSIIKYKLKRSTGAEVALTAAAAERLCLWSWPRNLREVDMLVGRLSLLNRPKAIGVADLPETFARIAISPQKTGESTPGPAVPLTKLRSEAAFPDSEIRRLQAVLIEEGGRLKRAAERLGISRGRAYRLMREAARRGPSSE